MTSTKKINMVILLDLSPHLNPKYKLKIGEIKNKKKNYKKYSYIEETTHNDYIKVSNN